MVGQRFERGKLDVQHGTEMIALPLHIGAQGLERVFLNRIADLPENRGRGSEQAGSGSVRAGERLSKQALPT